MDRDDTATNRAKTRSVISSNALSSTTAEPLRPTDPSAHSAVQPQTLSQQRSTPWQRFRRDGRAMVSMSILLTLVLIAIVGPPIYQHVGAPYHSTLNGVVEPTQYHTITHQELNRQHEGPSGQYWLGTDAIGRDTLARLMQGLLISLGVALIVELVDISIGVLVGILAGYYGGWIDDILGRFTDIMLAIPSLLFVILTVGIFGGWADTTLSSIPGIGANGNARLILVSLALACTTWPLMARYVRGQTLLLRDCPKNKD